MARDDHCAFLLGSWSLVQWRLIAIDGTCTFPFTPAAIGRLLYQHDGFMSVSLMHGGAKDAGARHAFIAYGGRYALHGETIHHLIDQASDRALVGTVQVRHIDHSNGVLTLSAASEVSPTCSHVLTWRRPSLVGGAGGSPNV